MTAYELRNHLAAMHDVRMSGADYGTLLIVHDDAHRDDQVDHEHHDGEGRRVSAQNVSGGEAHQAERFAEYALCYCWWRSSDDHYCELPAGHGGQHACACGEASTSLIRKGTCSVCGGPADELRGGGDWWHNLATGCPGRKSGGFVPARIDGSISGDQPHKIP